MTDSPPLRPDPMLIIDREGDAHELRTARNAARRAVVAADLTEGFITATEAAIRLAALTTRRGRHRG